MKIRNGFVSNSSSSSFIIQWQCNLNLKECEKRLDIILAYLLDIYDLEYIDYSDESWIDSTDDRSYLSKFKPFLKNLIQKTSSVGNTDNLFETEFFTTMRNDALDYGKHAMEFLMLLTVDSIDNGRKRFEIVKMWTDDLY